MGIGIATVLIGLATFHMTKKVYEKSSEAQDWIIYKDRGMTFSEFKKRHPNSAVTNMPEYYTPHLPKLHLNHPLNLNKKSFHRNQKLLKYQTNQAKGEKVINNLNSYKIQNSDKIETHKNIIFLYLCVVNVKTKKEKTFYLNIKTSTNIINQKISLFFILYVKKDLL